MDTALAQKHWSEVYFLDDGYNKMTEEQQNAMYEEVYKPIEDGQKEIARSNKRLMKAIKKFKGQSFYNNLKKCLKELTDGCGHVADMKYELVRSKTGSWNPEKYGRDIQGTWVDQWTQGMEGDSFAGYVYIEITPSRYLKVNYSM